MINLDRARQRKRPLHIVPCLAAAGALLAVGAPAAGAHSASRVRVASASQRALLRANHVDVHVRAARGTVRVRAFARAGKKATAISWTRTVRFKKPGTRTVRLPLSGAGRKLVDRCGVHLSLAASVGVKGHTVASAWRPLAADRTHCTPTAPKIVTKTVTTPGPTRIVTKTVPAPPPAPPAAQGVFQVGTAVEDISPAGPLVDGGYGAGYTVTGGVHDPLQVRAFFVGHGTHAVVFVSVDAQGWFAANQSPSAADGQDAARADAASALTDAGYDATSANVILSATHDHSAPTLQGIWGPTDVAYLHRVKLATVQAVQHAVANAQDAQLWTADGSIRGLVSQVQGTDQMAGFAVDDSTPILWARKPGSGATVGLYVNVPTHVDQYDPTESGNNQFSADYPGFVRDRLHELLGGTAVVGVGTLGRQESIGADPTYAEVSQQGRFVTNAITRALTHAHQITDTTVAAAQQSFSTEATNTNLIYAMLCNHGTRRSRRRAAQSRP